MNFQPGYYTIKAKHSDLFMAVSMGLKTDNALIVQWENQNSDEQKFKTVSREGYYSIEPKHSKKALAVAGATGPFHLLWADGGVVAG